MAIDDSSLAADVEALMQESSTLDDNNLLKTSERKLNEGLPAAVLSLLRLSTNATNENVRLAAAKYIVDSTLFSSTKDVELPIDEFIGELEKMLAG